MSYQKVSGNPGNPSLVEIYQNKTILKKQALQKNTETVIDWFETICKELLDDKPTRWTAKLNNIQKDITNGKINTEYTLVEFYGESHMDTYGPQMPHQQFVEVLCEHKITRSDFIKPTLLKKIDCPGHILDQCFVVLQCDRYTDQVTLSINIDRNYEKCCILF